MEQNINPGIYRNIDNHDYHSGPGLSATNLCELARSPLHYITSLATPHKETPAMKLGSATHCAILEPERFDVEYLQAPHLDRRTKEGKAAWTEIEQSGKILLSEEDYKKATDMAQAVHKHKIASRLLSGGASEQSIYWNQEINSLDDNKFLCKCRPDYLKEIPQGCLIVDLKTSQDAEINSFQKKAYWNYNYHIQAAHYMNGFEAVTHKKTLAFIFIVIESEPPYAINIFKAADEFINSGKNKVRELYELYASCLEKNNWPGYSEDIKELRFPKSIS